VQEVLDGADALDLARLGAEILDQIGLLELASQVDDTVFDIDVDLSLRHVGAAEDLALDLARQRDVVGWDFSCSERWVAFSFRPWAWAVTLRLPAA